MRRREFITLLGGAAAVWPLAAQAQQPEGMRRIGVLMTALESDSEYQTYISNLRQELQNLGWAEDRNLRIDSLGCAQPGIEATIRKGTGRDAARRGFFAKHAHHHNATSTNADRPHRVRFGLRSHRERLCHKLPASGR